MTETYLTEIVENIYYTETVEADSESEAIEKVKEMYYDEEIVLGDTVDFDSCNIDVTFNVLDDNYNVTYSEEN